MPHGNVRRLRTNSGTILTKNEEIASQFNEYSSKVGKTLADAIPDTQDPISDYRHYGGSMALFEVPKARIHNLLLHLKTNKATGVDGISNRILKNCSNPIATFLSCCINKCIRQGKYPDMLKRAKVVPVHKGGDKEVLSNYRPISVLPSINKIFESVLNDSILSFLKHTNFLTRFQYGFRKGSNTTIAAVELLDFIHSNLDKRGPNVVSGLFIDLSKAFDAVDHLKLLEVCEKIGIRGLPLDLLKSYLSDRVQLVSVNGVSSGFEKIGFGVPQGSVLGPTLFLIFVNDLQLLDLHGKLNLYADDAAIFYASCSDSENCGKMNEDLAKLSLYFASKRLTINEKKTKFMHFHSYSKALDNTAAVQVNGRTVERVTSFEYLGLVLDTHLSWDMHCAELCKRIRPIAGILFKLKNTLPKEALLQIYFAFVHSHLNYMVGAWGHAPATNLKPVQVLQNRCLKLCYSLDRLTPSVDLYSGPAKGILPVKGLQILFVNKFVRQVLNNELHHTVSFPFRDVRSLRDARPLQTCIVRTGFGHRKVSHFGPSSFNRLPIEIRSLNSTELFVKAVRRHLGTREAILKLLDFACP